MSTYVSNSVPICVRIYTDGATLTYVRFDAIKPEYLVSAVPPVPLSPDTGCYSSPDLIALYGNTYDAYRFVVLPVEQYQTLYTNTETVQSMDALNETLNAIFNLDNFALFSILVAVYIIFHR